MGIGVIRHHLLKARKHEERRAKQIPWEPEDVPFNMGAACMAAQIKNGPVPTKRIALMGEVARVACRARLVGMECRVVVDEEARACNR